MEIINGGMSLQLTQADLDFALENPDYKKKIRIKVNKVVKNILDSRRNFYEFIDVAENGLNVVELPESWMMPRNER
tara:strand:- start:354 stop:581 length:228 start_codon:yes stop_codon:yes gene_type:complete